VVTSAGAPAPTSAARQTAGVGDPLLTSKITVPGVPSWLVPRPRLDRLIAEGTRNAVTTVTGPPGAGKTMALALWVSGSAPAGPIAWLTIDDYDNRPRAFWSYVLAALQRAGVPIPRALSVTVRRYALDHEFLLRFASLMAAQSPPVTLVLDDLHLLSAPKVMDGLAYVLRHAGPGLRLVAASRIDPLLPLHRYRLNGELSEIRASDLAFTVAESRLLVAQHGVTLSAESLQCLTARAEGWAAVIRLAAISMDGHYDPDQFVKGLIAEDSAVAGYLVDEVLNAQPDQIRDFLLRTSVLDRINENVAAELTGGEPAQGVLADLARATGLVQRDEAGWYRYHSLFAAVLRLKLRREHPDQMADLHLRAARWYRRNGYLADAVRHAGAAGDWQFAARTVLDELAVDQLIGPPGDEPLAGRFRQMPRSMTWAEPQPLLVMAAIDLAGTQDAAGEAFLTAAEDMLAHLPSGDEIPSRLAASMIRFALSRRTGDLDAAAAAVQRAQALLEFIPQEQLAHHPWIEAQVLAGQGTVELWSGHLDEASAIFEAGAATGSAPERERADCLGHLALIETLRGRLSHAAELAADATGRPDQDECMDRPGAPASQAAEVALASVHLERNEISRARRWLKRALDALRTRPDKLIGAAAHLVAARHSLAEDHGRAALEIIDHARRGWRPPAWIEHQLTVLQSQACVATADIRSAIDLAGQADPGASLDAAAALAHALLGEDLAAARNALAGAPPGEQGSDRVLLAACLLDARLSYESGDRARGHRSLERALRLGEREQFRLQFAMERGWLRPVLRREPELAQAYRRLLEPDLIGPYLPEVRQPGAGQDVPLIVEALSHREREVLEHVSAMESTAEIASGMYISVNTVKTHLKSIYRKLSVTHRGEAVRRARQFGLL
jgi:LuxR family transcriptional regulator, maltose regulon positive regulatory protein